MTITRVPPSLPEHTIRDPEELAADITSLGMVELGISNGHLTHEKWIVSDVQVKPQYGNPHIVTVWSPCCGRPRQRLLHGYAFSCPACGWWWRYHWAGYTSRLVSIGKKPPA